MKSRYKTILATGMVLVFFGLLFGFYGYNNTWRLWNIPVMSPTFADLRTLTHGAESLKQGFDPMVNNPGDPWNRRLNYPRIWQSLYTLGLNQNDTTYLGIFIILAFLTGVFLFLPNANNLTIIFVFAAVLSPATLLGVERGNIDLLMFFILSISIVIAQRTYLLSAIAILIAFALKLFPIFGCAILMGANKKAFIKYILIILVVVGLYAFATWSDLLLIRAGTPRSTSLSYGLNVFWMKVTIINDNIGVFVRVVSYLSSLLIAIFSLSSVMRYDKHQDQDDTVYLRAFRVGSSIYAGTFILGNNWDYRLTFLIFAIPQLILWSKQSIGFISIVSRLVIAGIFSSLWYLIIRELFSLLPHGNAISFVFDVMSHWLVYSGLVYLLIWSSPLWLREAVKKVYPLTSCST